MRKFALAAAAALLLILSIGIAMAAEEAMPPAPTNDAAVNSAAAAAAPAPAAPAPAAAAAADAAAGPAATAFHITLGEIIAVILFLLILGYLGWLGYRHSRTAEEYLVAGRNVHPYIMALSYGATFISTSAIIGFGGFAGMFGMSLLWLTFLNIFVGIFIAFVFLGGPTRRMGHHLSAHTFPELLGKRYDSRFVQVFAGLVIFLFMPVYAAGVLLGGVKFLQVQFDLDPGTGILIFAVILALYVVAGGLRGVMYTDAFQGTLMFVGMTFLVIFAYKASGGLISAHRDLGGLADKIPASLKGGGIVSYATMPALGSKFWWVIVSSITLGVGIGVLAQPQLAVRFMTVHSKRELNRACAIGGIFILAMTGGAFVVGALSNVYFVHKAGAIALVAAKGDREKIIPLFITSAMPRWFGVLFLLSLLSAALSTLSSQFHVMGTSFGRDIYERGIRKKVIADNWTRVVTQIGVTAAIVVTVILAWKYSAKPDVGIIAKSTALFFALCASTFLPSFVLGLFWKRMNRAGAVASMLAGFFFSAFWLIFIQGDTTAAVGLLKAIVKPEDPKWVSSLLPTHPWPVVDALMFALPLSFVVAVVVALVTRPMPAEHTAKCFGDRSA